MVKRILVPLDGSATSEQILAHVEKLLLMADADVELAHVCKDVPSAVLVARAYLDGVQARVSDRIPHISTVVLHAEVATALLQHAATKAVDLIMLTTHGRSGLPRMVFGSTAERLMHASRTPLYLARPDSPARPLRKILVPLDGSDRSRTILQPAAAIAAAARASVVLTTVVEELAQVGPVAEQLGECASEFKRRGVGAEIRVHSGDPVQEILAASEREEADLIAISTHGRTGLERLRYGSVAESILRRSTVPLLVLRTAGFPRKHRLSKRATSLTRIPDQGEWL